MVNVIIYQSFCACHYAIIKFEMLEWYPYRIVGMLLYYYLIEVFK
jgi:hypothetical protein